MPDGVRFQFDGMEVVAQPGQTVASALLSWDRRILRWTGRRNAPRGLFCGMGICHDCLVRINGRPGIRACQAEVKEGICVETQRGVDMWDTCS
jgi:succinate dehydrogenase/fumarate reductase-like Fe-S protein